MSLANSDSEGSMFGSEEFGSGIDSGMGLDDADGGFIGQTSDEVAMAAPVMPPRPIKKKGFTVDSFMMLISFFLMLAAAIILFTYLDKIPA